MEIIVDRGTDIPLLRDVAAAVSPLCRGQPPPLRLEARFIAAFSRAFKAVHGVDLTAHLVEQMALGLREMDPVLLLAQLPVEEARAALLLPYAGDPARCIEAFPDPASSAIAALSSGATSIAVDGRWNANVEALAALASLAAATGVGVQLILSRPLLELPGRIYMRSNVPASVKRATIGPLPGDVDQEGRPFEPILASVEERAWRPVAYSGALRRAAEVLGVKDEAFDELIELGYIAYKTA